MTGDAPAVDLRSDTVTLPTPGMWERMRSAPLGDDGLEGDPSVRNLERYAADLLGKEEGLYVPSATMGNLIAILTAAGRGEQVVAEANSHIYAAERGGAGLSGAFYLPIPGTRGAMDTGALIHALDQERSGLPTALICLETTHNNAGGVVLAPEHMRGVHAAGTDRGIPVHLDGARLFNAAVALGVPVAALAQHADTVTICLSKGLSAPVGAVLAGPGARIRQGRAVRKMLGGSQRQAGIMASAGLEGLSAMADRLRQDHATAARLSQGLNRLACGVVAETPDTNIVMVSVADTPWSGDEWAERLQRTGVLVRAWAPQLLRCVTHRHIDLADIDAAIHAFGRVASATAVAV